MSNLASLQPLKRSILIGKLLARQMVRYPVQLYLYGTQVTRQYDSAVISQVSNLILIYFILCCGLLQLIKLFSEQYLVQIAIWLDSQLYFYENLGNKKVSFWRYQLVIQSYTALFPIIMWVVVADKLLSKQDLVYCIPAFLW